MTPPAVERADNFRRWISLQPSRNKPHNHLAAHRITGVGERRQTLSLDKPDRCSEAAGSVSRTQNVIGWLCSHHLRPQTVYHSTFQMNIQKTDNNTADIRTLPMVSATSRCYFTMLELTGSRTAEYHIFQPDITLSCDISLTCSSTKENSICILYIECIFLALSFLELLSFTVEKRGPHTTARQYQLLLWFSN